jgi:rsbT co-antagonist protein RsbR
MQEMPEQPLSSSPASPHRIRLGLRQHLMLAPGLITLLLASVAGLAIWGIINMHAATHQAITIDGEMSRLADEVAIQALLCRRYEKDFLLNFNNVRERSRDVLQWQEASDSLGAAIEAFGAAAISPQDQRQARIWTVAHGLYADRFRQVVASVNEDDIVTQIAARRQLDGVRENITTLTDLSVQAAERKAVAVQQAEEIVETISTATIWRVAGVSLLAVLGATFWTFWVPGWLMRPINQLQVATGKLADGELDSRVALNRSDELGMLSVSFDQMATTIQQRTAELQDQYASANAAREEAEAAREEAEAAREEAEAARQRTAEQLEVIEQQQRIIHELSVPILPLTDKTMVMPLVGTLDSSRLALVQERALEAIERFSARYLILDITAVPVIDTQVAQGLIQTVQASQLLGAKVILVGIRPEVAQAIISLGIQLDDMITLSSLERGVAYTLRQGQAR